MGDLGGRLPAHIGTYALAVLSGRTAHIAGYGRGYVIQSLRLGVCKGEALGNSTLIVAGSPSGARTISLALLTACRLSVCFAEDRAEERWLARLTIEEGREVRLDRGLGKSNYFF